MHKPAAMVFLGLAACGESPAAGPDAAQAPVDAASDAADGPDRSIRQAAADQTAMTNPDCVAIGDFYWEIGNATAMVGHGQIGTTYTSTKVLSIASSSKWVFGAYMVQAHAPLTAAAASALRMLSGYHGLNPIKCSATATMQGCLDAGTPGPNYTFDAAEVDHFHYDGAHDQFFAVNTLGLGSLTPAQLTTLVTTGLGISPGFVYSSPLPSGGLASSPAQFAIFLRGILSGALAMHDHLGEDAVCTLPGAACPTAVSSPSPLAWHYSYNHWVEDDPAGDGAFSSAGAFGFYPWISADRTLYGILSRNSTAGGGGFASATCGAHIRKAWTTGRAQ